MGGGDLFPTLCQVARLKRAEIFLGVRNKYDLSSLAQRVFVRMGGLCSWIQDTWRVSVWGRGWWQGGRADGAGSRFLPSFPTLIGNPSHAQAWFDGLTTSGLWSPLAPPLGSRRRGQDGWGRLSFPSVTLTLALSQRERGRGFPRRRGSTGSSMKRDALSRP